MDIQIGTNKYYKINFHMVLLLQTHKNTKMANTACLFFPFLKRANCKKENENN